MARTSSSDVKEILDTDLSDPVVGTWIDIANELVDDIANEDSTIDSTRLTKIEKLLSAHLVRSTQDKDVDKESIGDVTLTYEGDTGMHINATRYGQQAAMLDPTGLLSNTGKPAAGVFVDDAKTLE